MLLYSSHTGKAVCRVCEHLLSLFVDVVAVAGASFPSISYFHLTAPLSSFFFLLCLFKLVTFALIDQPQWHDWANHRRQRVKSSMQGFLQRGREVFQVWPWLSLTMTHYTGQNYPFWSWQVVTPNICWIGLCVKMCILIVAHGSVTWVEHILAKLCSFREIQSSHK